MSAMPYGTTIVLSASKSANGTFAVENLKKQLADQLKRNDREALYYNVYAEDEAFAGFELGRGYIELK